MALLLACIVLSVLASFVVVDSGDCRTANVWADCDNELHVYLKDESSGSSVQIGEESNWHTIWSQTLYDMNESSVIEFKCVDHGVIGAFIATIEYNDVLYSTSNPLTSSNFVIVEPDNIDTSSLVYHSKSSAPWHNNNAYIAADASWVWNNKIHNAITFDFAFKNIMSSSHNSSSKLACDCNEECVIDCDKIDARKGCSNTVIDGRQAASLKVICASSEAHYTGGCQLSTIYCPQSPSSQCNIECKDYYACYLANIYSSYSLSAGHGNVSVSCDAKQGSCLKTTLYANKSWNAEIKCFGAAVLGSKQHSACDSFNIHAEDIGNKVSLMCTQDYSCYSMQIHANNAHKVYVGARGDHALSTTNIYAQNADTLKLFCGSEASEYGCHNVHTYAPTYEAIGMPRSSVTCHGHGCFANMFFYSAHGALDFDIALNGCGECNDVSSCVGNGWYFYCHSNNEHDVLNGDVCDTDACDCSAALNMVHANWENSLDSCDVFTYDYECTTEHCVVDCMKQWPHDDGCFDKAINARNATSLTVICNASTSAASGCQSAHIYCPNTDGSRCEVLCSGKDACYDTEISVTNTRKSALYLKCKDSDSCSHSTVYGAANDDIFIHCIATDSCQNMNVTATAADNVTIHCEGNAELRSFGACDGFTINAQNVSNDVRLVCNGDYSCYSIHVFAHYANHVIIDSIGNFGSFGGAIYAQYVNSMHISCKSQYNEYGCYKMQFYMPSKPSSTTLHCEGHGCHYLDLRAPNGYNDLGDIWMNGCGEVKSASDMISHWAMQCGDEYALVNSFDGDVCRYGTSCGCNVDTLHAQMQWLNDDSQCNMVQPDHVCNEDGKPCVIDCTAMDCSHDIIFGAGATSLTVQCGADHCNYAQIYCPSWYHSLCTIECGDSNACTKAQIYGEKESIVQLHCDKSKSCGDVAVDVSDTFETMINCTAYGACGSLTVYGNNASHISMNCYGNTKGNGYYDYFDYFWNASNDTLDEDPVCAQISINAPYVSSIEINCIGNDVCYPSVIDVSHAQDVRINGIGSYSIYSGTIDASAVQRRLTLHFESSGASSYGVEEVALYVPSNDKTYLNCIGYGCHNLRLYAANGMRDVFAKISFYGCNQCMKAESCIAEWYLYCGASYEGTMASFTGSICQTNDCHCNELKDEIEASFILDVEDAMDKSSQCHFKPDVSCAAGKQCVVDCTKTECEDKVIYGGKATSLTVLCSEDFACNWMEVYCPETGASECNILCTGFDTCYSSTVYGDHQNIMKVQGAAQYSFEYGTVYGYDAIEVNVTCNAPEACYKGNIYASKAQEVYVTCDMTRKSKAADKNGTYGWYYDYYQYESKSPCYGLNIYAYAVSDDVYLHCAGDYACYETYLYAHDARNVAVVAHDGEYAMKTAHIYASNASSLDLSCRGIDNNYGCAYLSVYLPPSASSLSMQCYGFGCDNLYLYSANGFVDMLSAEVHIHSCGVCSGVSDCIDAWHMYCNQWDAFDVYTIFDGVSCIKQAPQCGCRQFQSMKLLKSAWIDDDTSECDNGNYALITTTASVTPSASHTRASQPHGMDHTMHNKPQTNTETHDTIGIFIVVISVIVLLCIVANICYCYRKRMNEAIAHQILQGAEEGGIQEIALEPMSANIGQQMNIVSVRDGANTGGSAAAAKQTEKYKQLKDDAQPKDGSNTETGATVTAISAYALANQ